MWEKLLDWLFRAPPTPDCYNTPPLWPDGVVVIGLLLVVLSLGVWLGRRL